MLIGGRRSFDDWQSYPVVAQQAVKGFSPDEPIWWALPDDKLVALYRDNGGSGRLFRSFYTDRGRTWTTPVLTSFPNATSKIFSLRTSKGDRVLIYDVHAHQTALIKTEGERGPIEYTGWLLSPFLLGIALAIRVAKVSAQLRGLC